MIRTHSPTGRQAPADPDLPQQGPGIDHVREELQALEARLALKLVHVLSNPPAGWRGEKGFINAEIMKRHLPPPYLDHEYFICGPNPMMGAIEKALGEMHVPL